ncbi:MAG: hypothetical protein WC389_15105 [Lutibacter sp.]|jgi:hypothetical protein
MKNKNYPKIICEIINSDSFKTKLSTISYNYTNLKQENNIRNVILEELNQILNNTTTRAFAEHPRIEGSRVDLSIIDQNDIKNPYKIEFKYQFTKDDNEMENYHRIINKDFEFRKSDLFILTISNWNIEDKKAFDQKWNISSNLSRYISKTDNWKKNIIESFKKFKTTELIEFEKIKTESPYGMEYYFFILKRI